MSSLQERLANRREQLQGERTVVLPIPGYEDMLAARYRVLAYRELRKIGRRNADAEGTDDGELNIAAETLARACVELLEVKGEDEYVSTGHTWSSKAVDELFGIQLGPDATPRDALFAVFPPTETELMMHFGAYDQHLSNATADVDREVFEGESQPSAEGLLISP